jgi:hypothetical protein
LFVRERISPPICCLAALLGKWLLIWREAPPGSRRDFSLSTTTTSVLRRIAMLLFIPRSLCALKRVASKAEHSRFGATQGIRIALASGVYRVEACDGRRAIVVHGLTPLVDPPWPGFKELPDDACEAIILPKDLERACKVGEEVFQRSFDLVGLATIGNGMCLGIGADVVTARTVEGRFPKLEQAVPKKRPLFSFRIDPKLVAETLLAIADLLPEGDRGVQCFYYGEGLPLGFCARNGDNGILIDALVVPLTLPKSDAKEQNAEDKTPEGEDAKQEGKPKGRGPRKSAAAPEANAQATPDETGTPAAGTQQPQGQDAEQTAENSAANCPDAKGQDAKKSKKAPTPSNSVK